jgi:hypothetical protein
MKDGQSNRFVTVSSAPSIAYENRNYTTVNIPGVNFKRSITVPSAIRYGT